MFQLVNSGVRVEGDEEGWGKCPFLLLRGEGHHGKDYKSVAHQVGLRLPGEDHLALDLTHKNSLTDLKRENSLTDLFWKGLCASVSGDGVPLWW